MRALIDGTPLLGTRTGIGHYTDNLLRALSTLPDVRPEVFACTLRGWRTVRDRVPPSVKATGLPVPARALRACWSRAPAPPVESLGCRGDVVHGTNFVLPPSLGASGVVTVHDLAFLDGAEQADRGLGRIVRRSVRRAAVVCTPTWAVAERTHERLGVPWTKLHVTPLGVRQEWFRTPGPSAELRARYALPDDYLLFVGADGPRKSLSTLLRALGPSFPPLVIAGPAGGRPTRTSGSVEIVRTGYLADDALRSVVAGARALVLPSRDEGFGLPALEAMATGTPVVCSDIAALREVTGGLASLFEVGDVDALRSALSRTIERSDRQTDRGRRRAHAAGFSWTACARATREAYRVALE